MTFIDFEKALDSMKREIIWLTLQEYGVPRKIIQINTLRIILKQSVEWQAILCVTFIDFEKAFDSMKREIMWLMLQECGIPSKIIQIIKILYDGFKC